MLIKQSCGTGVNNYNQKHKETQTKQPTQPKTQPTKEVVAHKTLTTTTKEKKAYRQILDPNISTNYG